MANANLAKAMLLVSASAMAILAFGQLKAAAQVPPILPTDVTGPMAGGGGPEGMLDRLQGGYSAFQYQQPYYGYYGYYGGRPYIQVRTLPSVVEPVESPQGEFLPYW